MTEHVRQIQNKRSLEYQQTTLDTPLLNRYTGNQRQEKYNSEERFENSNPEFTRFFQGQANLNTDRVAGYYYNAHIKEAFENPPANKNLECENSLFNHRIQYYDQSPSPTPWYPTYRDDQNAPTLWITRP